MRELKNAIIRIILMVFAAIAVFALWVQPTYFPYQRVTCNDGRVKTRDYEFFPKSFPRDLYTKQMCCRAEFLGWIDFDKDSVPDVGVFLLFDQDDRLDLKYVAYVRFTIDNMAGKTTTVLWGLMENTGEGDWKVVWVNREKAPEWFAKWLEKYAVQTDMQDGRGSF
jgi:hypothetical protein